MEYVMLYYSMLRSNSSSSDIYNVILIDQNYISVSSRFYNLFLSHHHHRIIYPQSGVMQLLEIDSIPCQ